MQYGGSQISSVLEHDVNVGCIKEELVTKFGVHKTDGRASLFTGPLAPQFQYKWTKWTKHPHLNTYEILEIGPIHIRNFALNGSWSRS